MQSAQRASSSAGIAPLFALSLSAAVAALALSVLVGWAVESVSLVQVRSDFVPMQPNTALGLLLLSLGVVLSVRGSERLAVAIGVGVLALGWLTLMEYLTGVDLAIDRLVFEPFTTVNTSHPGRMAPNTALCFVLLGGALVVPGGVAAGRHRATGMGVLGGAALLLGLISLVGYFAGLDAAYGWGDVTFMAFHTAIAVAMIGAALAAIAWMHSAQERQRHGSGIAAMTTLGLMVSVGFAGLVLDEESRAHGDLVRSELRRLESVLGDSVTILGLELEALAARQAGAPITLEDRGRARRASSTLGALRGLRWVDARSGASAETATGLELEVTQVDGSARLRVRVPHASGNSLEASLDAAHWIEAALQKADLSTRVNVRDVARGLSLGGDLRSQPQNAELHTIDLHGQRWQLRAWAKPGHPIHGPISAYALVGGIFFTLLATYALSHRRIAIERTQEVEATSARLARSNEELGHFTYIASHDLQEPLRMLTAFASRLGEKYGPVLEGPGRTYIEFILDASERMGTLIEDLLRYSRVEAQAQALEPVDANVPLTDALESLRERIEESGAEISCDRLPVVLGTRLLLFQLFENLIENAIKFRRNEVPQIRVSVEEAGRVWRFTVSDNASGIDPAHQEKIFQIFERLPDARHVEGTGIGLAVCKKIVDRLGGSLTVRSTPGVGSTFSFDLVPAELPLDAGEKVGNTA